MEISGLCNARCPWCVTGNRLSLQKDQEKNRSITESHSPLPARFMTYTEFETILDRLNVLGVINASTCIYLYNWGEPFLNPDLNTILSFLERKKLHYALSTNASKYLDLSCSGLKMLADIIFSVPGFNQTAYDKIHGFDFKQVLTNIEKIIADVKRCNRSSRLYLAYHVYQFNLNTIIAACEFCLTHDIIFLPYYAYINDFNRAISYLDDTMDRQTLYHATKELFLHYVDDLIKSQPEDYVCPQSEKLVIDEHGNLLLCCSLPKEHPQYSLGSILRLNSHELFAAKGMTRAVCRDCLKKGLAFWGHHPKRPEFIEAMIENRL